MTQTPTDALRLETAKIIDPAAFLFKTDELMKGDTSQYDALRKAERILALAAPASPPAYVRTPNEDDRLRRALYRLLDRHGAGPDVLSVIGSLWDTLDQGECTDLIEDWLITGKTMQAEGDIDEMLASIPEEAPHRCCRKGACCG